MEEGEISTAHYVHCEADEEFNAHSNVIASPPLVFTNGHDQFRGQQHHHSPPHNVHIIPSGISHAIQEAFYHEDSIASEVVVHQQDDDELPPPLFMPMPPPPLPPDEDEERPQPPPPAPPAPPVVIYYSSPPTPPPASRKKSKNKEALTPRELGNFPWESKYSLLFISLKRVLPTMRLFRIREISHRIFTFNERMFTVFFVEFDLKPKVSKVKDYVIIRTLGSGTYGTVKVCNPLVSFICFSTHVPHTLLGCLVVGS